MQALVCRRRIAGFASCQDRSPRGASIRVDGSGTSKPSFRGDSSARTWPYRVALNTALTWQRSETRRDDHRANLEAGMHGIGFPSMPPAFLRVSDRPCGAFGSARSKR